MTCNETCRPMYAHSKRLIEKDHPKEAKQLKGIYVEGPSGACRDYYWVKVPENGGYKIVWEGSACCKWAARFNALLAFSENLKERCKYCGQILDDPNDSTTADWGNGRCLKCTADVQGDVDAIKQMYDTTKDPKFKAILKNVETEERLMEIQDRLRKLHRSYYGSEQTGAETEFELITDILEQLVEHMQEQKDHSHNNHY